MDVAILVHEGSFLEPIGAKPGTPRLLLATGNGVVKRSGELVMGAGSAKALARAYPQTPKLFGEMAQAGEKMYPGGWYLYGLLTAPVRPDLQVGVFQTKGVWREDVNLYVISYSTALLARWLRDHPNWEVHMTFPDVGREKAREDVLRVLKRLLETLLGSLYQDRAVFLYAEPRSGVGGGRPART